MVGVLLLLTFMSYMIIEFKYLLPKKSNGNKTLTYSKYQRKGIIKIFDNIFFIEITGSLFLIGTVFSNNLENNFFNKNAEIPLIFGIFIIPLTIMYLNDRKKVSKFLNTEEEEIPELYEDRKNLIKMIDFIFKTSDAISITGEWGIGKTIFIKNYIKENRDKYEPIYIDISLYPEVSKVIEEIELRLDKQFKNNNILNVDLSSVINIFRNTDGVLKTIYYLFKETKSTIETKELMKEKIIQLKKNKNKKILLCLDNFERISPDSPEKIISVLAVVDKFFRETGVKVVYLYDIGHLEKLFNEFNISFKDYISKYSQYSLEIPKIPYRDILRGKPEENNQEFIKVIEKLQLRLKNLENELSAIYEQNKKDSVKATDFRNQKTEKNKENEKQLFKYQEELLKYTKSKVESIVRDLNNPRYLESLTGYCTVMSKSKFSSENLIEYMILKDNFPEITRDKIKNIHTKELNPVKGLIRFLFYKEVEFHEKEIVVVNNLFFHAETTAEKYKKEIIFDSLYNHSFETLFGDKEREKKLLEEEIKNGKTEKIINYLNLLIFLFGDNRERYLREMNSIFNDLKELNYIWEIKNSEDLHKLIYLPEIEEIIINYFSQIKLIDKKEFYNSYISAYGTSEYREIMTKYYLLKSENIRNFILQISNFETFCRYIKTPPIEFEKFLVDIFPDDFKEGGIDKDHSSLEFVSFLEKKIGEKPKDSTKEIFEKDRLEKSIKTARLIKELEIIKEEKLDKIWQMSLESLENINDYNLDSLMKVENNKVIFSKTYTADIIESIEDIESFRNHLVKLEGKIKSSTQKNIFEKVKKIIDIELTRLEGVSK